MAMLTYVGEYIYDGKGLLDVSLLKPHHREFLVNLSESNISLRDLVSKLVEGENMVTSTGGTGQNHQARASGILPTVLPVDE